MRPTVRRAVLVSAVVPIAATFLAACLPERDNPLDPAIRPNAALEIASSPYDEETGVCGPVDSLAETLNRGRCLHLDAEATTDPQDDIASYAFALLDTAGNAVATLTVVSSGGSPAEARAIFPPPVLRTLPGGPYTAHVTVTDRREHDHSAERPILLENARPIAAPPGTRRIDHWAPAWDPGSEMVVPVTGAGSFDPDGDPVQYCWRAVGQAQPLGPAEILDEDGHCYSEPWLAVRVKSSLSARSTVLLEHWLTDAGGESARVHGAIVQDTLPGWVFEEATGRAKVLDVYRRVLPVRGVRETFDVRFDAQPGKSVVYVVGTGGTGQLHRFPLEESGPPSVPDADSNTTVLGVDRILGIHADPGGSVVWVTSRQAGELVVHALDPDDLSELDFVLTGEPACGAADTPLGGLSPDGALWVAQFLCGDVHGFRWDGQQGAIIEVDAAAFDPPAPGELLTSVTLREGDGPGAPAEVWAVYGPDVINGYIGTAWARVRLPDGTVIPRVEIEPDVPVGFTLSFLSRRQAWLNDFTQGMSLFECVGCDPAGAWPPAGETPRLERVLVAEGTSAGFLAAVQPSGTIVFSTPERYRIERVSLDGSAAGHDTVTRVHRILGPDPEGSLWTVLSVEVSNGPSELWFVRGEGSGIEGVVQEIPVGLGFAEPTVDYSSGDLWTGTVLPYPGAARIRPDGRHVDHIRAVSDGVVSAAMGPPVVVASDPETGWVWLVEGSGVGGALVGGVTVYVADPYAERPVAGTAMTPAGAGVPAIAPEDLGTNEMIVRAVPQVLPGTPNEHALILVTLSNQPLSGAGECASVTQPGAFHVYLRRYVLETDTLGEPLCAAPDFDVEGGDDFPRIARDLSTGEICMATRLDGVSPERTRHVRLSADLKTVLAFSERPASNSLSDVRVTAVASTPRQCWAVLEIDGTRSVEMIDGLDLNLSDPTESSSIPPTETIRPVIGPNQVSADSPESVREVWLGGSVNATSEPVIRRVFLDGSGTPKAGSSEDAFPIEFDTIFLVP